MIRNQNRHEVLGLLIVALVGVSSPIQAAQPSDGGDPLPRGAIRRLGVARFAVNSPVTQVAYSRDGRLIAAVWQQREPKANFKVGVWEASSGRSLRQWDYRGYYLRDLTFLDDGKSLVAGGTWWDLDSGEVVRMRENRRARTIRPDGERWVFDGDKYGIVHFFDSQLDRSISTVVVKTKVNGYEQFVFSPQGNVAAGSTYDGQLHLYAGDDGKHLAELKIGEKGIASLLAFSPDERLLAAGGGYLNRIWVYDARSGKLIAELPGHENGADTTALTFTHEGRYLASAGADKKVLFWDVKQRKEIHQLDTNIDHVAEMAFSPDGARLVTGGYVGSWTNPSGKIRVWDLKSGRPLLEENRAPRRYRKLAFSPDGRKVAGSVDNSTIHVFQIKSGRRILTLEGDASQDLQFSLDSWELIAVGSGAKYQVWELPGGDEVLSSPNQVAYNAGFTRLLPDRKHLMTVAGTKVLIVDLKAGETVREFRTEEEKVYLGQAAASADGRFVVVNHRNRNKSGNDGLYVFDAEVAEFQRWVELNIIRKDHEVYSLLENPRLSADGSLVAAWVRNTPTSMVFWDVVTGRFVRRMTNVTRAAQFTRNGKYLLDIQNADIVLFELATGQEAMRRRMLPAGSAVEDAGIFDARAPESVKPNVFVGQVTSPISAMAVSLDGRTLATGMTRSNTILLWPLDDPKWSDYPPQAESGQEQFEELWSDLAELNAAAAYRAIWFLTARPELTEAFVVEKRRSAEQVRADTRAIAARVKQANSADADERDEAREKLLVVGAAAEPILQAELLAADDPASRRRIKSIIDLLQSPVQRTAGEPLRRIRLVQLLEHLNTAKSRELLRSIASGSPTARETRDARAALARLKSAEEGP